MFARIMAVVMTAILLTTVCLSAVWWLTLRNSQIDARLDYLISEAEEIAFLAGNLSGDNLMDTIRDRESVTRGYLNKLADKVNQEFGAYIAVMDRGGNVMTNSQKAYNEDPGFVESLSGDEIVEGFQRIMAGETIRLRTQSGTDPNFTVGVPFMMGDEVTGAVFIRTKAQKIESGLSEILVRIALLAAGVMALSSVVVFLFVRRRLKPLNSWKPRRPPSPRAISAPRWMERPGTGNCGN